MLTMLMITPPKKRGRLAGQWRKIFPPPVSAYLDSAGNTPYVRIICEEHPKGIDWRMVGAHSLESSGRLLLPKGCQCPTDSGMRRFTPTSFTRRMMENLALETLLSSDIPPAQRSAAIYGSEAEIVQLLPQLVPLVGSLRIITRRGYAVRDIVTETMRQTGMPITVTDEPDAGESALLLAPFGGAGFITAASDTVIIAPDRPRTPCAAWIGGVRVNIPAALEEAYDVRYDTQEFVGAFYELGGMRELARLYPSCGISGNSEITAAELAGLMKRT